MFTSLKVNYFLKKKLSLLIIFESSKNSFKLAFKSLDIWIPSFKKSFQLCKRRHLLTPSFIQPCKINIQFFNNWIQFFKNTFENIGTEPLNAIVQPQISQYFWRKWVLRLKTIFNSLSRSYLQLNELSDSGVPMRPKIHKINHKLSGRFLIILEQHRFNIQNPLVKTTH